VASDRDRPREPTGGVAGRRIELDVRDLESADQAPDVMASLRSDGVSLVLGTYSSDLSVPASTAADDAGCSTGRPGRLPTA